MLIKLETKQLCHMQLTQIIGQISKKSLFCREDVAQKVLMRKAKRFWRHYFQRWFGINYTRCIISLNIRE